MKTQTIHTSGRYSACVHPVAGLIVQSTKKNGGVRLCPDHPQFEQYLECFKTAIDATEADAICRALINQ